MSRILGLLFGIGCYGAFLVTFLYLIGFVGDFAVPRTINNGPASSTAMAVLINLGLLSLFGLQHSVMARQGFKAWWTRMVPRSVERSTYVLFTAAVLAAVFWWWQALPQVIWAAEATWLRGLLWAGFAGGLLLVFVSTCLIDHFELFGLQQVWRKWKNRPHTPPAFAERSLYRLVRHPLYVGWLLFFWLGPEMTLGRALFAAGMTAYILIAIQYEERDLVRFHGQDYVDYRKRVPMLVPRLPRGTAAASESASS